MVYYIEDKDLREVNLWRELFRIKRIGYFIKRIDFRSISCSKGVEGDILD